MIDCMYENQRIEPLYNIDSYVKEVKYRLQVSNKLAEDLKLNLKNNTIKEQNLKKLKSMI